MTDKKSLESSPEKIRFCSSWKGVQVYSVSGVLLYLISLCDGLQTKLNMTKRCHSETQKTPLQNHLHVECRKYSKQPKRINQITHKIVYLALEILDHESDEI